VVLTTTQAADEPGNPMVFKGYEVAVQQSTASGGDYPVWNHSKPIDIATRMYSNSVPAESVVMPYAYLVPRQWTEVIDRLQCHGVPIERLPRPATVEVESYRFFDVKWRERPFEGRHEVSYRVEPLRQVRTFAAGCVLVRLDHPSAKVAVHLLEPQAPDALVRWGFFDAIFEQKEYYEDYALAPMADKALATDSSLRDEFESWLAAHPYARGSARARLDFFFERSPYWDGEKDVYPVGRLTHPVEGLPSIGSR
jgi:hypothetical protein